jgi:hypothetical protein
MKTVMKTDDTVHQLSSKRTTPFADIKSKRDETVHKQINSNTAETSVNKLNYSKIRTTPSVTKINYIKKIRKTPSVKNEKNMQRAPSASDDTVHKQLLIPKRTASVNKVN